MGRDYKGKTGNDEGHLGIYLFSEATNSYKSSDFPSRDKYYIIINMKTLLVPGKDYVIVRGVVSLGEGHRKEAWFKPHASQK